MSEIRRYPFVRHLRADASSHVLFFRRGRLRAGGRGLAFWFSPLSASIAEIPVDHREQAFLFHGRSADFQDVTAQGLLTFRVEDPEALAACMDFTIDLATGLHLRTPLEKLAGLLSQLAQGHAWDYIAGSPLRQILAEGQGEIRRRIADGLAADQPLRTMGIAVVSVAVQSVKPTPDLERALEAPARERIQQDADEAAFARRAMAVEKERAIQENELTNRIELARQSEQLIAQEGQNQRREAGEKAEALRIAADGEAARRRVHGQAEADNLRAVEGTRVEVERERLAAFRDLPPPVLLALAAQELAGKLDHIDIEHLNLTPDLLGSMVTSLVGAATHRLDRGEEPA